MNTTLAFLEVKSGFWKRQLQLPGTPQQHAFDLFIGVVAPVLCVFLDPTVFRTDGIMGPGLLSHLRLFAYLEIAMSTVALGFFLVSHQASVLLAGALLGGFFFAVGLGVMMLPLTVLGLVVVIGVLGLTPFLTGFVFFRNAWRCWRESSVRRTRNAGFLLAALGITLMLGIPAGFQASVFYVTNRAMAVLQSGSDRDVAVAVQTLRLARYVVTPDGLAFAYQKTTDERQRGRLARAFHDITGQNVEERLVQLND